jgi:hypothetical protein
MEHN